MASVFKLGRDKKKRHAVWYFEYQDHKGKKRMRKGFTDKSLTEQLAVKMETNARLRRMGYIDDNQAEFAESKDSAVSKHIDDFERSLSNRKNTSKHVNLTIGRVRRIVTSCGFETLGQITADAVEDFLVKLRVEEDFGHRTYNHYLQAMEGFCNWLVKKRRIEGNPVLGIERLNNATDVRHQRRALSAEEFSKLVLSARESSESIQCYDGETRARIYILSYMTGLRRGELASLTPQNFNFRSHPPTVTVHATISKHRRKDVLPLHPDLVELLKDWFDALGPDERLFPKLAKRRTWLMVKKDLERVGIPYETAEGIADFHAAGRHTHITELLRNGASLPVAKELARHADVKMTMRYTHIGINDQARALRGLRMPCQDIVRKSGDSGGPNMAVTGTHCPNKAAGDEDATCCEVARYDTKKHKRASDGSDAQNWRRRESNPRAISTQQATAPLVAKTGARPALHGRCILAS
jgi:integrase